MIKTDAQCRKRLRPLIERMLNEGVLSHCGLRWLDKAKGTFILPWKINKKTREGDDDAKVISHVAGYLWPHRSRLKEWKELFRNALRSLDDFEEIPDLKSKQEDYKVYRIMEARPRRGRKAAGSTKSRTIQAKSEAQGVDSDADLAKLDSDAGSPKLESDAGVAKVDNDAGLAKLDNEAVSVKVDADTGLVKFENSADLFNLEHCFSIQDVLPSENSPFESTFYASESMDQDHGSFTHSQALPEMIATTDEEIISNRHSPEGCSGLTYVPSQSNIPNFESILSTKDSREETEQQLIYDVPPSLAPYIASTTIEIPRSLIYSRPAEIQSDESTSVNDDEDDHLNLDSLLKDVEVIEASHDRSRTTLAPDALISTYDNLDESKADQLDTLVSELEQFSVPPPPRVLAHVEVYYLGVLVLSAPVSASTFTVFAGPEPDGTDEELGYRIQLQDIKCCGLSRPQRLLQRFRRIWTNMKHGITFNVDNGNIFATRRCRSAVLCRHDSTPETTPLKINEKTQCFNFHPFFFSSLQNYRNNVVSDSGRSRPPSSKCRLTVGHSTAYLSDDSYGVLDIYVQHQEAHSLFLEAQDQALMSLDTCNPSPAGCSVE